MKSLPKLVIFGDPEKRGVSEAIEEFISFAKGKAEIVASYSIEDLKQTCKVVPSPGETNILKKCDFAIVFGGDGSIISTARKVSEASLPVIGVNVGKLGFLAEFSVGELEDFFPRLNKGTVPIDNRMMLKCRVFGDGQGKDRKEKFCSAAINDVFITAGPPL